MAFLWAGPWTLVGLALGGLALATGGGCHRTDRMLEFVGGVLPVLLQRVPLARGALAVTLGHVVLARSSRDLVDVRSHEWIHVLQYERWGPLFVPMYFYYWFVLTVRKRDGYWDNPFEVEARERSEAWPS